MRSVRKLTLLAVMALAAMAAMTPPASALDLSREVEPGNPHCSAVTTPANGHGAGSGGCQIHIRSVTKVALGTIAGMVICDTEFEGRLNEVGVGFIYRASFTNCEGGTVVPCAESGVLDNWPTQLNAETSMEFTFCVTVFGFINVQCNLEGISINNAQHTNIEFSTNGVHRVCDNSGDSVQGHWRSEHLVNPTAHPALEIYD